MDNFGLLQSVLAKLRRDLAEERRETELRRQHYERFACKFLGEPCTVEFCHIEPLWNGNDLIGYCDRPNGVLYRIRIEPGLELSLEHAVLSHEFAHAALGHAKGATLEAGRQGEYTRQFFYSSEAARVYPTVNLREIWETTGLERERAANRVGAKVFEMLFPGEVYRRLSEG